MMARASGKSTRRRAKGRGGKRRSISLRLLTRVEANRTCITKLIIG
uniref:Uncharacterized protein n=1 Tax=Setaria italica TaxID=4555 RepID=K4ANY0_SETIT